MAQRDLTTFRQVTDVEADKSVGMLDAAAAVAEIGMKIVDQNQQAMMTEKFSQAQLELNALQNQYQIDNESNPMGRIEDYKAARQEIFNKYADGISPIYRNKWNESIRNVTSQNDASMQGWNFKQTRVNTVNSVNSTIRNNLMQANIDGASFGTSPDAETQAFLNLGNSMMRLEEFGNANLGEETTREMMDKYQGDYIKSFIAGVMDVDANRAKELMDSDQVRASFTDVDQYMSMRHAVDVKAERQQKQAIAMAELGRQQQVIDLFNLNKERTLNYAELQGQIERLGLEGPAKNYFLSRNGFSIPRGYDKEVTQGEKDQLRTNIYDRITQMGNSEKVDERAIGDLQNDIYAAADLGAIGHEDVERYSNLILGPLINQRGEAVKNFSDEPFFSSNIGMEKLQEELDRTAIIPPEGRKNLNDTEKRQNNMNRLKLYDLYMGYIENAAKQRNIEPNAVMSLPSDEKRTLLFSAQEAAIKAYNAGNYPDLANVEDAPNYVLPSIPMVDDIVNIETDEEYNDLPSGTYYIGPDGNKRRKP